MEVFICIKMDLALDNLQWLICHLVKLNQNQSLEMKMKKWNKQTLLNIIIVPLQRYMKKEANNVWYNNG